MSNFMNQGRENETVETSEHPKAFQTFSRRMKETEGHQLQQQILLEAMEELAWRCSLTEETAELIKLFLSSEE